MLVKANLRKYDFVKFCKFKSCNFLLARLKVFSVFARFALRKIKQADFLFLSLEFMNFRSSRSVECKAFSDFNICLQNRTFFPYLIQLTRVLLYDLFSRLLGFKLDRPEIKLESWHQLRFKVQTDYHYCKNLTSRWLGSKFG